MVAQVLNNRIFHANCKRNGESGGRYEAEMVLF